MGMDGLSRARQATAEIERYGEAIRRLRQGRQEALREAVAAGATRVEIARALGITLGRVNQLLGSQYARGGGVSGGEPVAGGRPGAVKGAKPARGVPKREVKAPEPEPHRHRYVSEAWNHTRGAYLVRQRCECGDTRVVPAPSIPKDLTGGPDHTIVAA